MRAIVLMSAATLLIAGCGKAAMEKDDSGTRFPEVEAASGRGPAKTPGANSNITMQQAVAGGEGEATFHTSLPAEANPKLKQPAKKLERKIIYTANIDVVVKDFDEARRTLDDLIRKNGGYVANSDIHGDAGAKRSGSWTIRVPVAKSGGLRDAVRKLGYARRDNLNSEDVSREYYSLDIRIKNAEKVEQRYLEHLKKSSEQHTKKWEDAVAGIREKIEQMKGQLRYWETMSALSTIHLTLTEDKKFEPAEAPTFGDRIAATWAGSIEALQQFGKGVAIFFVAITPWLPFVALFAAVIWWLSRRYRKPKDVETIVTS